MIGRGFSRLAPTMPPGMMRGFGQQSAQPPQTSPAIPPQDGMPQQDSGEPDPFSAENDATAFPEPDAAPEQAPDAVPQDPAAAVDDPFAVPAEGAAPESAPAADGAAGVDASDPFSP
jgi:hypothetical protein